MVVITHYGDVTQGYVQRYREGHKQGYREVQEEHTRGLLVQRYKGAEVTLVTGTERYKKGGHHISGWCC